MFAVIETGGKQYIVKPGVTLKVEKLPAEQGKEMIFEKVLLVAEDDGSAVKMGNPYVAGAKVTATVEEQGRAKKILVVKFKRKLRYKRTRGHRQQYTKVKITSL